MLLTSINVGIQAISSVEDAGRAAAMYAFMRTLGMSIGVAIGGTVFQNLMSAKLEDLGLPVEIAHNSEAFVAEMAVMDIDDPVRVGALEACKSVSSRRAGALLTNQRCQRIPRCLLDHHRMRSCCLLHQPVHQTP